MVLQQQAMQVEAPEGVPDAEAAAAKCRFFDTMQTGRMQEFLKNCSGRCSAREVVEFCS